MSDEKEKIAEYIDVYRDLVNKVDNSMIIIKTKYDEIKQSTPSFYLNKKKLREDIINKAEELSRYIKETGIDRVSLTFKLFLKLLNDYFLEEDVILTYIMNVNQDLEDVFYNLSEVKLQIRELEDKQRGGVLRVVNVDDLVKILDRVVDEKMKSIIDRIDDIDNRLKAIEQVEKLKSL